MKKKKFAGKLGKKTKSRKSSFLAAALRDWDKDDKTASNKLSKILREEETEKLSLLGKHYNISEDQNVDLYLYSLCTHLAMDFVPGFQEEVKLGATSKWNYEQSSKLETQINALRNENSSKNISRACGELSKRDEWKLFLGTKESEISSPNPAEALRQAYYAHIKERKELRKLLKNAK